MYPLNAPITDVAVRLRRGYRQALDFCEAQGLEVSTYPDQVDTPKSLKLLRAGIRPRVHYLVVHNIERELIPRLRKYGVVLRGYPRPHTEDLKRI